MKKMMIVSELGEKSGIVGQPIEGTSYKIGDVILWQSHDKAQIGVNIICSDEDNPAWIMGWQANNLIGNEYYDIIKTVVPASMLTNELIQYIENGFFRLEEIEIREVTIDEIRKYVPFEFILKDSV